MDNPGIAVPATALSFPIALALSQEEPPRTLFVANANFDISYNAGSVQSYDLDEIARRIDKEENPCRPVLPETDGGEPDAGAPDADVGEGGALDGDLPDDAGEPGDAEVDAVVPQVLVPPRAREEGSDGKVVRTQLCDGVRRSDGTVSRSDDESVCCFGGEDTIRELQRSSIPIDSFASGIAVSPDGNHVYVPVRSNTRLLYFNFDAESQALTCGPSNDQGRCTSGPKLGDKGDTVSTTSDDREGFAAQPTSVATGNGASIGYPHDVVATSHETGELSLFRIEDSGKPVLVDVLENGPLRSVGLSYNAGQKLFYVSSTTQNTIERVGVDIKDGHPLLYRTSPVALTGLTSSFDVRDVQVDSRDPNDLLPLTPLTTVRSYALIRGSGTSQTQALLFIEQDGDDGRFAKVVYEVRLGNGPSKMLQADFGGRHLLFVSCYREGSVLVIDADRRVVFAEIPEFFGPFDMKIDPLRGFLYVTDFGASVVRVADIRGLANPDLPKPRIVATLGSPYFTGSIQ